MYLQDKVFFEKSKVIQLITKIDHNFIFDKKFKKVTSYKENKRKTQS